MKRTTSQGNLNRANKNKKSTMIYNLQMLVLHSGRLLRPWLLSQCSFGLSLFIYIFCRYNTWLMCIPLNINKCITEVSAELIVHIFSLCYIQQKIKYHHLCEKWALPCVATVTDRHFVAFCWYSSVFIRKTAVCDATAKCVTPQTLRETDTIICKDTLQ